MIKLTTNSKDKFYQILQRHIPQNAVHYCYDLWVERPFHFKITRKRNSKLGDYRYHPMQKEHTITVNHNLNEYSFLITYIHEYAHLTTTEKYHRKASPHGKEWKREFQQLMLPVLSEIIFPLELLAVLKKHMLNPKASSQSDPKLVKALRMYDQGYENTLTLDDLKDGEAFVFQGVTFKKLYLRRTRVLCHHIESGRRYLIPRIARVEKAG